MGNLNKIVDSVFSDTIFDYKIDDRTFFSINEIANFLCEYNVSYVGLNKNRNSFYEFSSKYITPGSKNAIVFCISNIKFSMKDYGQMIIITENKSMKISKRADYDNGGYVYDDIEIREFDPIQKVMFIHYFHLYYRKDSILFYSCISSKIRIKDKIDLSFAKIWLSFGIPNNNSLFVPSNNTYRDNIYKFDISIDKRNVVRQFQCFLGNEPTNIYNLHALAIKHDLYTILANNNPYSSRKISYREDKFIEYKVSLKKRRR